MWRASRRRRALPESFAACASEIATAQRALLAAVPTFRDDGVPLGAALAAFRAALDRAAAALTGWDDAAAAEVAQAIDAARSAGEDLRLRPGTLSFADLNEAIGNVLAPLEDVTEIERRLR